MTLRAGVRTSFVMLHSDWSVERARHVLDLVKTSNVIVHRYDQGGDTYYYLYERDELLDVLARGLASEDLRAALELREDKAAALVEAADAGSPTQPSLVHVDGRVIGFVLPAPRARGMQELAPAPPIHVMPPIPEAPSPRTISTDFPAEVVKGESAWLLVSLSSLAATGRQGLDVVLKAGESLDVLVQATKGFAVVDNDRGTLVVSDEQETLPLRFKLQAQHEGRGKITVMVFNRTQALGALSLSPMVRSPSDESMRTAREGVSEGALAPVSVRLPDLSMLIEEQQRGDSYEYFIRLVAQDTRLGLNWKKFGPLTIRTKPETFFAAFFEEIQRLPASTPAERATVARKLSARASYLFQSVFPPDLQRAIWGIRSLIRSVQILSEEPWIPWELCRLCGDENGRIVEGSFLCEAYEVTRWVPGIESGPLSLKEIALVSPTDSGLAAADTECRALLALSTNGRRVTRVPATWEAVYGALRSGQFDGIHFTGHGGKGEENADRSVIALEGGTSFTPMDVSGEAGNLRLSRPIVFLNACHTGVEGMSVTGIGGWAHRFLEAGAGAFLGTFWAVDDDAASRFSEAFYKGVLAGRPMGEAVKEARVAAKQQQATTWLAYTVFADPLAVVQTGSQNGERRSNERG